VRFHALTDHVATVMARRLAIPRHRIDVIPRGRDPVRLGTRTDERRAAARRELGVGPDEPLVIAAARHERQKGLDVLLRAVPAVLARQPRTRFVIAGRNGGASQELAELAGRVAGAVDFVGQRDDVGELMCAADVWCVPSRWEGFGGILIEAMALEVPAVASDIPPIREVTGTPSCVTLVPPDQPLKLADAICRVFDDPAGAQLRTTHGRQRFLAEFTVDRVADRMVEFYERAHSDSRLTASMLDRGFG
jgi:glycosyltransferase involved in cell wall biosynthesis